MRPGGFMKNKLFVNLIFLASTSFSQNPSLQFNHSFIVLDSSDYLALTSSDFVKNELAGFFTRSTNTKTISWTGSYIFGDMNYLEIFAPSGSEHPLGTSAISLGSDRVEDLQKAEEVLSKTYKTQIELKQRKVKDSILPWFRALYILDSGFAETSNISFWIMEYERDYFLFNHWDTSRNLVSRKIYLDQHKEKRENKYLSRFTGIEFYATKSEIDFYNSVLIKCGFRKVDYHSYISTEGFTISFQLKPKGSKYTLKNLWFETMKSVFRTIQISDHIKIDLKGEVGSIEFN